MTHEEAGHLGGLVTASRYDMKERGRQGGLKGGRPRLPTIQELLAQQPPPKEDWWITLRRVS